MELKKCLKCTALARYLIGGISSTGLSEFFSQRFAVNTQYFRGLGFIPADAGNHVSDMFGLNLSQGSAIIIGIGGRISHMRWQIENIDNRRITGTDQPAYS